MTAKAPDKRRFFGWALAAVAVLALGLAGFFYFRPFPRYSEATVRLGGGTFRLDVADTAASREKGLSGRESVPENGGMLFLFESAGLHAFWMKGMKTPIDIIWLSGGTVVSIKENASPPSPDVPENFTNYEVYMPSQPADKVVEVAAGTVKRLGVQPGQKAEVLIR